MKIESGQIELEITVGCPLKQIEEVLEPFYMQMNNRNIELLVSKMETNIFIDWRKYLLSVFNLVQNAVKYNKEGGSIKISFGLEKL
jgi:signal transduction histidine kinase